jgi:microcompartment protein CcmL/EutN
MVIERPREEDKKLLERKVKKKEERKKEERKEGTEEKKEEEEEVNKSKELTGQCGQQSMGAEINLVGVKSKREEK